MVYAELEQIIMEEEYHIKFPKTQVNFTKPDLVFLINKVKSRLLSTLYFKLYCYNRQDVLFYTYTSPRWVIDTEYRQRKRNITLSDEVYNKTLYTQIELISLGNSSENPLYFTECMLSEYNGDIVEYHKPYEKFDELNVGLINNSYVNLYDKDNNYLQVIRPKRTDMTTKKIIKDTCTVLAPHLSDESDIDDPVNVFMEFINQTEQRIDVLR